MSSRRVLITIDVDPIKLADKIISDFKEKMAVLGWER